MRSLRVLSIVAACVGVVGSANAQMSLYKQVSNTAVGGFIAGGDFSDGLSTGGQFYSQTMADDFTVGAGGWNVIGIRFWGSSENFFGPPDLSNFSDFDINIMSSLGTVSHSWTVSTASLSPVPTGNANLGAGIEYEFLLNASFTLAAGTHWINIGSKNIDPNADSWAWSWSSTGNSNIAAWDFGAPAWTEFQGTNLAFEFIGPSNVVPEPFTMALGLGAAGAYIRRRRRK